MAKKSAKPETKSDFLRRVLDKDPLLDHREVNRRWAKAGRDGEISAALFYQVRNKMGIKIEWVWAREDPNPKKTRPAAPPAEVYQLKITLKDSRPPIWRRIQIGDGSLEELHEHIQAAMGWTNSHMHHFRVGKTYYVDLMMMQDSFGGMEEEDASATSLSELIPPDTRKFRFEYEYDFGDGWRHEVVVEKRLPPELDKTYPLCLDGARACPPEDVGGVWGYDDLMKAMADPEHERHAEFREWLGAKFDPDAFDPTQATRRMRS